MEEKIKENLGQVLQLLLEGAKSGIEFTKEQTPLLIKEILAYNFVFGLVIFICLLAVNVYVVYLAFKANKEIRRGQARHRYYKEQRLYYDNLIPRDNYITTTGGDESREDFEKYYQERKRLSVKESYYREKRDLVRETIERLEVFFWVSCSLGVVIFFINLFNLSTVLKIMLSPRLYIIDYLVTLISKK